VLVVVEHKKAWRGKHVQRSAFSTVKCVDCGARWRSKGSFVEDLPRSGGQMDLVSVIEERKAKRERKS